MNSEWKRNNDDRPNEATASGGRRSPSVEIIEDMESEATENYAADPFDELFNARSNASNDKVVTHKSTHKSIVSSHNVYENDDPEDNSHPSANGTLYNSDMFDSNDLQSEATGFDPARAADIDADAALALKLQQEEYDRESLATFGRRRFPFDPRHEHDPSTGNPPQFYPPSTLHDEMFARQMFHNENGNRNRVRIPRAYAPPFMDPFAFPRREGAAASQTTDDDQPEVVNMPSLLRFHRQREPCNDDDDDSDGGALVFPDPSYAMFRRMGGHPAQAGPMGLQIFGPFRSRHRRAGGNLQDTEDDFGPEDYERLLQLDDSIKKKQLTSHQINKIKTEKFTRPPNNTDEENLCSICLERFEVNETLRRYPCSHLFHQTCSDRWLKENNVCPICRKPPVEVSTRSNSYSRRPPPGSHERPNQHRSSQNRNTNSRVPGSNNRWSKNSHQS